MKITFTGITKEEAIKRLEDAIADNRAYAARMAAKADDPSMSASCRQADRKVADTAERKATKFEKMICAIRTAKGQSISIDERDEGILYWALAQAENTFEGADALYSITPESIKEMPFELMLSIGGAIAQKTE